MKNKGALLILLILGGYALYYANKKKYKTNILLDLKSGFNPEDVLSNEEKTMFEL